MNNILNSSTFFGMFLTLAAYVLAVAIKKKLKSSLINPLLIAIMICIAVILCKVHQCFTDTGNSMSGSTSVYSD